MRASLRETILTFLQVLELKKANPGTVLMVEVGYKYKFFGEDAHVRAAVPFPFTTT